MWNNPHNSFTTSFAYYSPSVQSWSTIRIDNNEKYVRWLWTTKITVIGKLSLNYIFFLLLCALSTLCSLVCVYVHVNSVYSIENQALPISIAVQWCCSAMIDHKVISISKNGFWLTLSCSLLSEREKPTGKI